MMAENDPENLAAPDPEVEAAREIAKMISDFRQEVMDKTRQDIEAEQQKIEADGFDPARGRGRCPGGPRWAEEG
jgi:hypothetical protein